MIERRGGKTFLHFHLVCPTAGPNNTFFVERDFKMQLNLAKATANTKTK